MAVKYLASANVKMYPSAYRSESSDPESYYTTEGNITKASVLGLSNKSFVEQSVDESHLTIVRNGYRFEVSKANVLALFSDVSSVTNIYAEIRTTTQTGGTFETLVAFDTGNNELDNDNSKFVGLAFNDNNDDTWSNALHVLTKSATDSSWGIPDASKLVVDASQVDDSKSGVPISQQLTTDLLAVDRITSKNIMHPSIQVSGLDVVNDVTANKVIASSELKLTNASEVTSTANSKVAIYDTNSKTFGYANVTSSYTRPADSGNNVKTIASITQDSTGKVSVTDTNLPLASNSTAGLVSTGNQTFSGEKTFTKIYTDNLEVDENLGAGSITTSYLNNVSIHDIFEIDNQTVKNATDATNATNATNASKVSAELPSSSQSSQYYYIPIFRGSSPYKQLYYSANINIQPSTGEITTTGVINCAKINAPVQVGNYREISSSDVIYDSITHTYRLEFYLPGFSLNNGANIKLYCTTAIPSFDFVVIRPSQAEPETGYVFIPILKDTPLLSGRVYEFITRVIPNEAQDLILLTSYSDMSALATTATNAVNTDFTNSEWVGKQYNAISGARLTFTLEKALEKNKSYEFILGACVRQGSSAGADSQVKNFNFGVHTLYDTQLVGEDSAQYIGPVTVFDTTNADAIDSSTATSVILKVWGSSTTVKAYNVEGRFVASSNTRLYYREIK